MFLFARLAMDYLFLLDTEFDLLQEIGPGKLPIGSGKLDEMYVEARQRSPVERARILWDRVSYRADRKIWD